MLNNISFLALFVSDFLFCIRLTKLHSAFSHLVHPLLYMRNVD